MDMETRPFIGLTGRSYLYSPADLSPASSWNPFPGNYAFVVRTIAGDYVLYFGECQNFVSRPMPPQHERWHEARATYGATHVLAHVNYGGVDARRDEEQDLIRAYNPPMNVQHRTGALGLVAASNSLFGLGALGRRGIR
jgi:hypothetical protein